MPNKLRMILIFGALLALTLGLSTEALAWGGRGHHTICETAVYLVKNPQLQEFLRKRSEVMGHLCNVPDIYWRSLAKEQTNEGNPSHFLDSEIIPLPMKDYPADYEQLVENYTGKKRPDGKEIKSVPHELGSLWWRADQFYRRAVQTKATFSTLPADFKLAKAEEQNPAAPYNAAVFQFYTSLGLMGHFVGDNSMPFHVTNDYDGYDKGHGGIHGYYEDQIIDNFDGDLGGRVEKEAQKLFKAPRPEAFLKDGTVIEKMRSLTLLSYADIDKVLKADTLLKPSEVKDENGQKVRAPAQRLPAAQNFKKFEGLALKHLARASALLAQLWDQAYLDAGSPRLEGYRNYNYPFTPEFITPDYYKLAP